LSGTLFCRKLAGGKTRKGNVHLKTALVISGNAAGSDYKDRGAGYVDQLRRSRGMGYDVQIRKNAA
jgi:hypothetical protein